MKNFKSPGKMLRVEAGPTGGVLAGALCIVGDFVGIAANTVAVGAAGHELSLLGVYKVPKAAPLVITQGDKVYAVATNTKADAVDKTSSARVFVGWAWKSALSADTTVEILLPMGGYADI
jgi:predicted RecA/RadA family phage recombinase